MGTFTVRQFIALAILLIIIVAIVIFLVFRRVEAPFVPPKEELTLWGVFDDSSVWEEILSDYHRQTGVKITYRKFTFDEYEDKLLRAIALGQGPDIFYLHHTGVPKFRKFLTPLAEGYPRVNFLREYQDTFVDVVFNDFVDQGLIWAMPLYVDTFALYWNRDLFNQAGIVSPPKTWEEFQDAVKKLSKVDAQGNILQAGAAIGGARNINRSTDIVAMLMMQQGSRMVDRDSEQAVFSRTLRDAEGRVFSPGIEAVRFYTEFANPTKTVYTWQESLPYSIDAFYGGERIQAAMMINYSHHIKTLRAKAANLKFGIAPIPQLKQAQRPLSYANYWGLGVSSAIKDTPTAKAAWDFLLWMGQKDTQQKYLELTGLPTARRDLIEWQRADPNLGVFAEQSLIAASWWQPDARAVEDLFLKMLESVLRGEKTIRQAVLDAETQITVLFKKIK